MSNQSDTFFAETQLTALDSLINEYQAYASEEGDLQDMYMEDMQDFVSAKVAFRMADPVAIDRIVARMDTAPRESLIVALHKDAGNQFVQEVLGYSVN